MWILAVYFILMAVVVVLGLKNIKIKQMEKENLLMRDYMKSIEDSYTAIRGQIEAVRKYKHDLAKHIQTLEHILARGIAKEYYCADEIVNSILNERREKCWNLGIPFLVHAEDTQYSQVSEMDIAAILHNLLDNAVEADERISETEKHGINLYMGISDGGIWIEVKNHLCPGELVTFETNKEQKEDHGFGVQIIEEITQKYHGKREVKMDREEHTLMQTVYLPELVYCKGDGGV